MMNRVLAEKAMKKMSNLKFDALMTAVQELGDDFEKEGATSVIIDKIYALNFTIILSAQGRGITYQEYCNLILEMNYQFCKLDNLID